MSGADGSGRSDRPGQPGAVPARPKAARSDLGRTAAVRPDPARAAARPVEGRGARSAHRRRPLSPRGLSRFERWAVVGLILATPWVLMAVAGPLGAGGKPARQLGESAPTSPGPAPTVAVVPTPAGDYAAFCLVVADVFAGGEVPAEAASAASALTSGDLSRLGRAAPDVIRLAVEDLQASLPLVARAARQADGAPLQAADLPSRFLLGLAGVRSAAVQNCPRS